MTIVRQFLITGVFNENLVPPPADKAEVRVIHASPDAREIDVVAKQGNKKLYIFRLTLSFVLGMTTIV
jgi:hypothetical protein